LYDSENKKKSSGKNRDASPWIVEINLLQGCHPLVPTLCAKGLQIFADTRKKTFSTDNISFVEAVKKI
jgi:hypothetical protein